MALRFEPRMASATDPNFGIEIREPRILPGETPGETEYQYPIFVGGLRLGLGFYGTDEVVNLDGEKMRIARLRLSPDDVLRSILKFKARIDCQDSDFDFLVAFAQGLINVFKIGSGNRTRYRCIVFGR